MIDAGVDFDFVGSMTDHYGCGTPVFPDYSGHQFDTGHEGHWGWRCDEVIDGDGGTSSCRSNGGGLANWLTSYTPDIALIHLGTNDLFQGSGGNGSLNLTIGELETIIDILRADNPNITILLAQLIPTSLPEHNWKIPLFNAKIPDIAVNKYDPNSPIIIVDQFTGYDPVADNQSDGVHPNESGEEKMAQKWADAILQALGRLTFEIKVYPEGLWDGNQLGTGLNQLLPANQPFNQSPWNYPGTESVAAMPAHISDWVLLNIYDCSSPAEATSVNRISQISLLIDSAGILRDTSGVDLPALIYSPVNDIYVSVHFRNHLPVLSSGPLTAAGTDTLGYDFTTSVAQAYGAGLAQKSGLNGAAVAVAGDINADGIIDESDINTGWQVSAGVAGYLSADLNGDGTADNRDKNDYLVPDIGYQSQLPAGK
ncbi:MAG: hypothetical protein Kow00127_10420 [Bacteroidales bacterium]